MAKSIRSQLLKLAKSATPKSGHDPYISLLGINENNEVSIFSSIETLDFNYRCKELHICFLYDNAVLNDFINKTQAKKLFIYSKSIVIGSFDSKVAVYDYNDEDFIKLNEFYSYGLKSDRPYVTLSFGMSLDGKIATHTGDSKYISGSESRRFVHELRNKHDAILVGINTIKIDHPLLTTRLNKKNKDPIRVVLDSLLSIDVDEPVLNIKSNSKTIIICNKLANENKIRRIKQLGHDVIVLDNEDRPLSIDKTLKELRKRGIYSLLVEGGSTVHFSFIKAGLFNRLYATISPIIIGGDLAKGAVGGKGFDYLVESQKLNFNKIMKRGADIIVDATPRKEAYYD